MRLQGAIFDMDGTLVDSMPMLSTLWRNLLLEMGREPEPGLDYKLNTVDMLESAVYCRETYGLTESVETLTELANSRVETFYAREVLAKPDVEKLLSILKMQGVWMYVASATDRPLVETALRHTKLDGYFRGILTASEAGAGKDDPRIFEKCLTRLRCRREECVVFEDFLPAARTAKAAGFRVAAVYDAVSEADQEALSAMADYYIRSYGEFLSAGGI